MRLLALAMLTTLTYSIDSTPGAAMKAPQRLTEFAPSADTTPRICSSSATGNLTAVKGACPAGSTAIRYAGANIFDSLWVTSTGMGTCCNATGGPAVWEDALAALEDARTSGVRVFRFFASLFGAGNQMWVKTPALYWQQYDKLMDAIERKGLYCIPSIGTGKMWMQVANAVTPGLNETVNDVVKNASSVSWRLQAKYFQEFTQRYAKRHSVLIWELGNELNLLVDLPAATGPASHGPCAPEQCYNTAAMVDYTSRLVAIIQKADAKRPVSSGFSAPRASAYHQAHCPQPGAGKCKLAGGYWGLDSQEQWLQQLAAQNSAVDVISLHHYFNAKHCYFNKSNCGMKEVDIVSVAAKHFGKMGKVIYVGEYGGENPNFTGPSKADQAFPAAILDAQVGAKNILLSTIWAFESPSHRKDMAEIWPRSKRPKEAGSARMMGLIDDANKKLKTDDRAAACNVTVDSTDRRHGPVRAGDDFACLAGSSAATLDACVSACCASSRCKSFSYNAPWALPQPYMTSCVSGKNCCCLKDAVPPLEANKWAMNITTGKCVKPLAPAPLCVQEAGGARVCCSLNGALSSNGSACACDAGWRGRDCGELNLLPLHNLDGAYQTKGVNLADCETSCGPSSWGGLPLRDDDGVYHLFASQFVKNCTLAGWNPGSTVIRATASRPEGPFAYAETVFSTFHHNPTVRELNDTNGSKVYVMLMIGDDVSANPGVGAACSGGNKTANPPLDVHHLEGYIKMAWSKSLLGPWTQSRHTMVPPGSVDDWDAMVTNPAPLFLRNGTAIIYYRGTMWPKNGNERIGFAVSKSGWKGPYGRPFGEHQPLWDASDRGAFVEDPSVWEDARGFHMLSHGHFDESGYLAYARRPEGPWHFRHAPTYTNKLQMANGSVVTLVQRERPQLFFDPETGVPELLFTGVAPPGAKFYGFTYTHAHPIRKRAKTGDRWG